MRRTRMRTSRRKSNAHYDEVSNLLLFLQLQLKLKLRWGGYLHLVSSSSSAVEGNLGSNSKLTNLHWLSQNSLSK